VAVDVEDDGTGEEIEGHMKMAEARRIIWERLATTAREDGRNVDWFDEAPSGSPPYNDADARRLEKASEQVAETIERLHLKGSVK